jgi:tRNA/rRNA methyltransferase
MRNEDIRRCQLSCAIPSDSERSSLNLSQAVQVVAYECRRELMARLQQPDAAAPRSDRSMQEPRIVEVPASVEQTEGMFEHLERGLVAVGYLDPEQPKHLMARLRHLLQRARPNASEVDILRGVASAMQLPRHLRAGRKKP